MNYNNCNEAQGSREDLSQDLGHKPDLIGRIRWIKYKTTALPSRIRYAFQRAKKGYCDLDVWNIDAWFLRIMPRMLSELKDCAHGYPPELLTHYGNHSVANPDPESAKLAEEEWKRILSEIIFCFSEAGEDTCSRKNPYEEEWNTVTIEPKKLNKDDGLNLSKNEKRTNAVSKHAALQD